MFITQSESVTAFAALLISRGFIREDKKTEDILQLINDFLEVNRLGSPNPGYAKRVKMPVSSPSADQSDSKSIFDIPGWNGK